MKTLRLLFATLLIICGVQAKAQTIAVGQINTYRVFASSKTAAKLVRLELVRLDKFNVLDEFDMNEVQDPDAYDSCFSKSCLIQYGKELDADQIISGSIDKIGPKIVISLKLIDIHSGEVKKTVTDQFDDQETELQRMIQIMVEKLYGIDHNPELYKQLSFKNEMITSNNVGRVNNSGPRMGVAATHGTMAEFMTRSGNQGGLDMLPVMSNLGYQFEVQYVGTENFSALFEFIPMLNGLEQGKFLPSVSVMNGFRFGQAGWEFAFGPSFGVKKESIGFFDKYGELGTDGKYWSVSDLRNNGLQGTDSFVEELNEDEEYYFLDNHLDGRGDVKFSTRWVMAFGRSFRSGALNIPVNVFYSSSKGGGMLGMSVGFNITRSKQSINN
jgi:TolB-like protein